MSANDIAMDEEAANAPVLELRDVEKHFSRNASLLGQLKNWFLPENNEPIRAIDGVDMALEPNQVQGIIGESGCGKTTLLDTIIGLYTPSAGEIMFNGTPSSEFSKKNWKNFRRNVQIVFQDPFSSLDPKLTVREILKEPLQIHNLERDDQKVKEVLEDVKLDPPEHYIDRLPRQLSGGEMQRVSIARSLILEPDVLLADEPTSMLDVSTQVSILHLLRDLSSTHDFSMIYVSHDLSTVSYICDRVNVMYLGRIIESAPTSELIENPKHPYTQNLIKAIPIPDPSVTRERTELSGRPPDPSDLPQGCRFKDRCPERMPKCDKTPSMIADKDKDHNVACHLYSSHVMEPAYNLNTGDSS